MEIQIRLKESYGKMLAYPANVAAAGLADIAGTRTLTIYVLDRAVQTLGVTIAAIAPFTKGGARVLDVDERIALYRSMRR